MTNGEIHMVKRATFIICLFIPLQSYAIEIGNVLQNLSVKNSTESVKSNQQPKEVNNIVKKNNNTVVHGNNDWIITKGMTLNQTLYLWTKRAGWDLVWDANLDYMITSDAVIQGDFNTAINGLFAYTGQMDPPIFISLYAKNKVLRVSSEN